MYVKRKRKERGQRGRERDSGRVREWSCDSCVVAVCCSVVVFSVCMYFTLKILETLEQSRLCFLSKAFLDLLENRRFKWFDLDYTVYVLSILMVLGVCDVYIIYLAKFMLLG